MNRRGNGSALLDLLEPIEREQLLARCVTRNFQRDEQIVREQDKDTNIYFIEQGRARVNLISSEGKEVSFKTLEAGDHFGEIAFIDGQPRSANVVALTETRVSVMPPAVFQEMLDTCPAAMEKLAVQLAAMVRRLCGRIFEYSTVRVNYRIQAELLRMARNNQDLDGVCRIHEPPTHAEMASRISCHREAVSRELKRLENLGVLAKASRKWIVADRRALENLVNEFTGG